MANNEVFAATKFRSLVCTHPATPVKGDPVIAGQQGGVAITSEAAAGGLIGETTVALDGQFELSVKGIDGGGDSAVAAGDILYYTSADTPPVSKKNTGVRIGYARGVVATGATTTIPVEIGY